MYRSKLAKKKSLSRARITRVHGQSAIHYHGLPAMGGADHVLAALQKQTVVAVVVEDAEDLHSEKNN